MIAFLDILNTSQIAANIVTVVGVVGVWFLIKEHNNNRDTRNIQLMHRCIDKFNEWANNQTYIDGPYLDFLNEELFYFQNELIQETVAIEWIEGILDYIQVYSSDGTVLNPFGSQELNKLAIWTDKKKFYQRIDWFTKTTLNNSMEVPGYEDKSHMKKKRELAIKLYKHIKTYKY